MHAEGEIVRSSRFEYDGSDEASNSMLRMDDDASHLKRIAGGMSGKDSRMFDADDEEDNPPDSEGEMDMAVVSRLRERYGSPEVGLVSRLEPSVPESGSNCFGNVCTRISEFFSKGWAATSKFVENDIFQKLKDQVKNHKQRFMENLKIVDEICGWFEESLFRGAECRRSFKKWLT